MKMHCPENERVKRRYFEFLEEAKRQSSQSVDAVAKSLARFESYTKWRDFKTFHHSQAVSFKNHLVQQIGVRSGEKLSKATLNATLASMKRFFQWLAGQPGYRSKFSYSDAEYFNLPDNDVRVASARREQKSPTLEQVKHVLALMPSSNDLERRNRALVAFVLLTGARDSAVASLKIKHIDLGARCIHQDAREVKTKFRKTLTTYFFPVGEDVREAVAGWVRYLREEHLWGLDDPLFPATKIEYGREHKFEVAGLDRKCWSNAAPIRKVYREAFERAGLPYFNPHSFRNTLAQLGERLCKSPEEFKAWSQNLGHEQVLTTFLSYGSVSTNRQAEIIRQLGEDKTDGAVNSALVAEVLRAIGQQR